MTEQRSQVAGAERIEQALRRARSDGRLGFVPYVTAGDPDLDATGRLARTLAGAGADVLELGVPWSDPLADGPVNQRAAERALASGTTLSSILGALPSIRRDAGLPIVLFTYVNPLLRYGLERFAADAARSGVDGVLVTDLPPEEAEGSYLETLREAGLATIFLASPTSTDERLAAIGRATSGFVYVVPRTGVTGARTAMRDDLAALVERVRAHTSLPVAVGFGIAEPEQVRGLHGISDAFVVGSAIVDRFARDGASRKAEDGVRALAESLVAASRR